MLDILQNAVEAWSHVSLDIREDESPGLLTITVGDNGRGMDARRSGQGSQSILHQPDHPPRGTGLAALVRRGRAGRRPHDDPVPAGRGYDRDGQLPLSHPNRQPLGDITGTLLAFVLAERPVDLQYVHHSRQGQIHFQHRRDPRHA